jgi:Alginate lyase
MRRIAAWSLLAGFSLFAACSSPESGGPSAGSSSGGSNGTGGSTSAGGSSGSTSSTGGSGETGGASSGSGGDTSAGGSGGTSADGGASGTGGSGGVDIVDGGAVAVPKTVVLDGKQLADARLKIATGGLQTELANLLKLADAALTAGPWSVMDKTQTPKSGDKHDYMSLARYYWPSGGGDGCPYVHKDGQTNPDCASNRWDHASRHAAMDAIYNLSLAWYFTGQTKYADRAALVARTWFLDPAKKMNPNINFGEGVPCDRDGAGTGVLNWTEVIGEALDGISVLESGASAWTAEDQSGMRTWLTDFLKWLQTNSLATKEKAASNNHGTWYDTGVSAIMLYLGQTDAAKALTESSKKRIDSQIKGDGSQPEELARTNTWGYSNWNLEGFCKLASTAKLVGVDLWGYTAPGGGTIAKSADYLIQGALHGKTSWSHQQIIPLDQSWALTALHAAAEFANDQAAAAAVPMVPVPPEGDLFPLLKVCTAAAMQVN